MNVLAYVHLRNIHRSTGAGRVARELIEHVSHRPNVNMRILADSRDHARIIPQVRGQWDTFPYHLFASDTSIQQAKWLFLRNPSAESYWPAAEIVHCTGESYVPTAKARLVVTAHDAAYFDEGAHAMTIANFKQAAKWRFLYWTLTRRADVFHTVSQFSAERLGVAFPEIRSRLRVIHNGVSRAFFEPQGPEEIVFLRTVGLEGRPYILLPGGLHYRKNADLVLRAWPILRERNPSLSLVIAGHCNPEYRERAAALGNSVVYTGFMDDPQLRALYRHAQVVWFPSRYEGFGLPPLEAMACGTPVVTSNCTSLPEVTGGAALLADPNSCDENIELLETALHDTSLREALREKGLKRASEFSWSTAGQKLQNLYSDVL